VCIAYFLRPQYNRGVENCDERVRLSVFLSAPIFHKPRIQISHNFVCMYKYDCAPVSGLWRRWDTICSSGFVDDVMFPIIGPA